MLLNNNISLNLDYADEPTRLLFADDAMMTSRRLERELGCRRLENVTLIAQSGEYEGEVVGRTGEIVDEVSSIMAYPIDCQLQVVAEKKEKAAIYLGHFPACWGHYITDGLSKVWFFETEEFKQLRAQGVPVVFVSPWNSAEKPLRQLYGLLGVDFEIIRINENTTFETLYVPDNALYLQKDGKRRYTKEYKEAIARIVSSVSGVSVNSKYRKIYLSRARWGAVGNKDFGEKMFERVFKRCGYTIMYPEQFDVADQIAIYSHAESIISTGGSVAHNVLFCRPHTELIVLRKAFLVPEHQIMCNELAQIDSVCIDAHLSMFVPMGKPYGGPFFLYVNDNVRRFVKDRFGIEVKNSFSTNHFLRYARLCMKRPDVVARFRNDDIPSFYYERMREEISADQPFLRRCYNWLEQHTNSRRGIIPLLRKLYSCYFVH